MFAVDNSKKIKVLALSVAAALHGLVGLGLANMTIKPLTTPPITPPLEIEFITIEPPPKPVILNNLESAAPSNEPKVAQASLAQMRASLQAPAAEVETEPKQSTQDEPEPEVEQKTEVEPDIEPDIEPEPVNELTPDPEPEVDPELDAEQLLEQRRLQEAWEAHQRQLAKLQEQQRLENERREQQRLEQERLEQERLENARREQERLDHERREQERLANEQRERERLEQERQALEKAQREAREKVERQAADAAAKKKQNAGNNNDQGGGGQNKQNQVIEGGIGTISDASWRTKPRVSNFCSSRKDVDMTVQVSFRVDAEGKISNISLNGSTGDRNLDRQITRQVGRGRLHPFKEGNVTRVGKAIYPIVLRLQKDEACTN